uniref:S-formylglutathione hydrolase n=1 Tax=Hirondellea gigas TaxID=1518452 RepID=A0A6A7G7A4_9CRUS
MASQLKRLGLNKSFGGFVTKWEHFSAVLGLTAKFSIFMPAGASNDARVHCLYFLSGLTCNEDNFIQKAGATREANAQHLAIVCPDTSPRGAGVPTEDDNWDFGTGAGFYVDATTDGWKKNYKMYSYVTKELPALIEENFPVTNRKSVFGHSMGGHGALSLYLKNPGLYQSPLRPSHQFVIQRIVLGERKLFPDISAMMKLIGRNGIHHNSLAVLQDKEMKF